MRAGERRADAVERVELVGARAVEVHDRGRRARTGRTRGGAARPRAHGHAHLLAVGEQRGEVDGAEVGARARHRRRGARRRARGCPAGRR